MLQLKYLFSKVYTFHFNLCFTKTFCQIYVLPTFEAKRLNARNMLQENLGWEKHEDVANQLTPEHIIFLMSDARHYGLKKYFDRHLFEIYLCIEKRSFLAVSGGSTEH